jgi:protein dithiol oxidoreductase (disulfide-forming)
MHASLRLLLSLLLFSWIAAGAASAQVAGRDYQLINPPQPPASGDKIEVIEFFWYGCPHCYNLQQPLIAWLKRKPADVEFRRVPAVLHQSWLPLTRAYYAMEAMGVAEKLHHEVFAAIHEKKIKLQDTNVLFDWVAARGVDRQKFIDTYNSFGVQTRAKAAMDVTRSYDVQGTPAIAVHGRYLTAPSLVLKPDRTIDYDRYFRVLDQVIAIARKPQTAAR